MSCHCKRTHKVTTDQKRGEEKRGRRERRNHETPKEKRGERGKEERERGISIRKEIQSCSLSLSLSLTHTHTHSLSPSLPLSLSLSYNQIVFQENEHVRIGKEDVERRLDRIDIVTGDSIQVIQFGGREGREGRVCVSVCVIADIWMPLCECECL